MRKPRLILKKPRPNDQRDQCGFKTAEPQSDAKGGQPKDLTPEIAKRAYEIHKERAAGQTEQDKDWLEAEQETLHGESPK